MLLLRSTYLYLLSPTVFDSSDPSIGGRRYRLRSDALLQRTDAMFGKGLLSKTDQSYLKVNGFIKVKSSQVTTNQPPRLCVNQLGLGESPPALSTGQFSGKTQLWLIGFTRLLPLTHG